MRGFGGKRMVVGVGNLLREPGKLHRAEADDAGQRLAVEEAAVDPHQRVGMLRRDLDMIAEDVVVADAERADAGRFAVARLQGRHEAPAVRRGRAQFVERGVVARRDEAAVCGVERWLGDQRALQQVDIAAVRADAVQRRGEMRRHPDLRGAAEHRLQRHRLREPGADLREVARPAPPHREAGKRALQVRGGLERLARAAARDPLPDEPRHGVQPRADFGRVGRRRGQRVAERARPGTRHGAVHRVEQTPGAGARR